MMKSTVIFSLLPAATSAFGIPRPSEWGVGSDVGLSALADVLKGKLTYLWDERMPDVGSFGGRHDDEDPTHTIYELISKSEHTTKFAGLVDEHDDIVQLLNSTHAKHTLFVPGDKAFEHIPGDKKPDAEFLKTLLQFHIADGEFSARKLIHTNTVPTIIKERLLGDERQRLRLSFGFGGLKVNFYSKVVKPDIVSSSSPQLQPRPSLPVRKSVAY